MKTAIKNENTGIDIDAIMNATDDSILKGIEEEIAALEASVTEEAETGTSDAELEALLESLDETAVEEVSEPVAEAELESDAELEALLETIEAAPEAVAEPVAVKELTSIEDIIGASLEEIEALETTPEPVRAKRAAEKAPVSPRHPAAATFGAASEHIRTKLGAKLGEYAVLTQSQADLDPAEREASINAWLEVVDKSPKKVREKVINVLMTVAGHATLSCYTQIAVDMLASKKELTIADIRNRYLKRPYSAGTSSSQSSQMTTLLPLLGLSIVEGKTHKANPDSLLLEILASKAS